MAENAAMKMAERTLGRPPAIILLPFHWPDRRVNGATKAGFHRLAWDLRYPPPSPIELKEPEADVFEPPPDGPLVVPGTYTVRAVKRVDGVETWVRANDSVLIAGLKPGRIAAAPRYSTGGFHGAPITTRTVALVGGGDPAVKRIAGAIATRRPHLADWAPTIAPLLGVDLGHVDGTDLLR